MKRVLVLILALTVAAACLAGCGNDSGSSGTDGSKSTVSQAKKADKAETAKKKKAAEKKKAEAKKAAEKKAENKTASSDADSNASSEKKSSNSSSDSGSKKSGSTTAKSTCTITISCKNVLKHMDKLSSGKRDLVPSDGLILAKKTIEMESGDTVLDITVRAGKKYGIPVSYQGQTQYGTAYVEGINNLYEFDAGGESGWMYKVNGTYPGYGSSACKVKKGDNITWGYTLNLGEDLGESY